MAGTNGQPGRKVFVFPLLPVCFFPFRQTYLTEWIWGRGLVLPCWFSSFHFDLLVPISSIFYFIFRGKQVSL